MHILKLWLKGLISFGNIWLRQQVAGSNVLSVQNFMNEMQHCSMCIGYILNVPSYNYWTCWTC